VGGGRMRRRLWGRRRGCATSRDQGEAIPPPGVLDWGEATGTRVGIAQLASLWGDNFFGRASCK
jgi:hypothetical protein